MEIRNHGNPSEIIIIKVTCVARYLARITQKFKRIAPMNILIKHETENSTTLEDIKQELASQNLFDNINIDTNSESKCWINSIVSVHQSETNLWVMFWCLYL